MSIRHNFPVKNVWLLLFFSLIFFLLVGCSDKDPIRIGFAGELTGLRSGLGVDGRDGAQLAVDTINEGGGINGRPLELITKNDRGDPEVARQVDAELIEAGVVGIIGHMTSSQTAAVIDQINNSHVVLVSPTTSSDQFTGIEDNFFRVMPSTAIHGRALANHIIRSHQFDHVVGVYDLTNSVFSETLWSEIGDELQQQGVGTLTTLSFVSDQTDLGGLAEEIVAVGAEAVVFVSSDIDTALLTQHIRLLGSDVPLFSSGWAQTDELPAKGGAAVEGLEIVALYNIDNTYPNFQVFRKAFEDRYNRPPGFGSAYAYEAVLILAEALKKVDNDIEKLPDALVEIQDMEGVQSTISLDKYGDVSRGVYIAAIQDGQFVIIDESVFEQK